MPKISTKQKPGHKKIGKVRKRKARKKMKLKRGKFSRKNRGLPKLSGAERRPLNLISDKERELTRTLKGDRTLARRVLTLQEKNPLGTVPELVAMDWLNTRHHKYFYQVQVLGGRRAGGLVPDFVIPQGAGTTLALLVHGTYWHEGFAKKERDKGSKIRLIGTNVFGFRIDQVVEVWDNRLYTDRERTMNAAMAGVEIGQ